MAKKKTYRIGLVDADLLSNGTRHPNLALLKIAGYFRDNGFLRRSEVKNECEVNTYELLTNDCNFEELNSFDHIYISVVFSFTYDNPPLLLTYLLENLFLRSKVHIGGTGSYANLSIEQGFSNKRKEDMHRLEADAFLNRLKNKSGTKGIDMRTQMPDYHLYDEFVNVMEAAGKSKTFYKDYKYYSIGFLTRGCFRQCSFCVNKLEAKAIRHSNLSDFLDMEKDEKGHWKRPYIYLWDDNFLASPHWREMLLELRATGRPFQFRQGLDERLLAQNKAHGDEMAELLATSKYHGDYIFAFDNWKDRKLIVQALKVWKYHCPKKETKFYLFCGFQQNASDDKAFQKDVAEIFMRIKVLMSYGCLGYIMRHEDYKKAPLANIYVQIARWCNQPGFYRNLSFWQFCYKNQTYWEEQTYGFKNLPPKKYEDFIDDYNNGYYSDKKICLPLQTFKDFIEKHKAHEKLFLSLFNMSKRELEDPKLWERKM